MIDKDTIDEIKSRVDIVEVIGEFVKLKKSGQNFVGLSPFNNEKTPSFNVIPNKRIFKDFSSGKAGDAITFLMEHEKFTYVETIKWLAKKYNVEIKEEKRTLTGNDTFKQLLYEINEEARRFFRAIFAGEGNGSKGSDYIESRGFEDSTIKLFGVGYAPDSWNSLLKHLREKGYTYEQMVSAGLMVKYLRGAEVRYFDMFRDRVIFPISDDRGRTLAFGGRILTELPPKEKKEEEDKERKNNHKPKEKSFIAPKYINSAESAIYKKSNWLFGLYQATASIRKAGFTYFLEGYTDVMAHSQAGISNSVSSSGTALTEGQVRTLMKYTDTLVIVFDGDLAGKRAAFRGMDVALREGMKVYLVVLPEELDPYEYIAKYGAEQYKEFIQINKVDFISFKCAMYNERKEIDTNQKAEMIRSIANSIAVIPDLLLRELFMQTAAEKTGISLDSITTVVQASIAKKNKFTTNRFVASAKCDMEGASGTHLTDEELISLLVIYGANRLTNNNGLGGYIIEETADYRFAWRKAEDLYLALLPLVDPRSGIFIKRDRLPDEEQEKYLQQILTENKYIKVWKEKREQEPYITLNTIKLEVVEAILRGIEVKIGKEQDSEKVQRLMLNLKNWTKTRDELDAELRPTAS